MKEKFEIEYGLKTASLPVLWNAVGTPLGLSEWFAEGITIDNNQYTFTWENHDQTANLLAVKTNSFIQFQWVEDEGSEVFFELRIAINPITSELSLFVTDFAPKNEIEDTILLWNHQIEQLKRKNGL